MVGVTGGGGEFLGEGKLIRASAFWGFLARMASALKIKCPTLLTNQSTRFGLVRL